MTYFTLRNVIVPFLLFFPLLLFAQPSNPAPNRLGLVKGLVVDAQTRLPLEFATIALINTADSSVAAGGFTDEKGFFQLKADFGQYYLRLDFLGYQIRFIGNIALSKANPVADLETIALEAAANTLDEVIVRAEKSQVQMSLDKRVFNVGKDLANRGGTAADVLDNVPSVNVDVEGNVSLRGSSGVRILVDGRPSGLVGISNTNGLRQLPANLI
ncbi:MAG: carboxypeptidase-like regulatory domain-containing protein, partial [Lewinellaceae bacterium]|nr:carboxypeptidase-like regulatory domain-containing protein [Lewinellaceae bacterium]